MGAMASQITSLTSVYSSVYSGADKKISKIRVTGFCVGNSPETSEFSAQMASNAENVSIWWCHHVGANSYYIPIGVYITQISVYVVSHFVNMMDEIVYVWLLDDEIAWLDVVCCIIIWL